MKKRATPKKQNFFSQKKRPAGGRRCIAYLGALAVTTALLLPVLTGCAPPLPIPGLSSFRTPEQETGLSEELTAGLPAAPPEADPALGTARTGDFSWQLLARSMDGGPNPVVSPCLPSWLFPW